MMGFYQRMAADRAAKKAVAAEGPRPKYKVLTADMLKPQDRQHAAAVATFLNSGDEAYKLAGKEGFAYKDLDLRRRVGAITYKGVEVALLFHREVTELEPGPADPVPQHFLKEPSRAWLMVDLLDTDDVERKKGLSSRLQTLMGQVQRLQMLWEDEETKRKHLGEQLEKVTPELQQLQSLREKVALLEMEKKATDKELEGLRNEVRDQKEQRRKDKLNLVHQMFPVFNTVWLAGLHRVGDQLYGILKAQVTEALGKIGVKFIEPGVGDTFDPTQHHAIHAAAFPTGSKEIGSILLVHRVGWSLGGNVIEATEVSVGVEKENQNAEEESNGTNESAGGTTQTDGSPSGDSGGIDSTETSLGTGEVGPMGL